MMSVTWKERLTGSSETHQNGLAEFSRMTRSPPLTEAFAGNPFDADMVAVAVAVLLSGTGSLSVTVSVTVKVPGAAYVCEGVGPVASSVMPSEASKSHE